MKTSSDMDEHQAYEKEERVIDMNLEAKVEKDLLMHGYMRRDFNDEQIEQLRSEIETLEDGECSLLHGFWSIERKPEPLNEDPDHAPKAKFMVGERVWVTEHILENGIPGVGIVRKVEKEWIDLEEELKGYWEITYQLKNMRVPFTEDHVFATELEALVSLSADFRRRVIEEAGVLCRRMRALGMNITPKEMIANIVNFI